ncbi:PRK06851 family protein [Desulfolucanica intricata]|uniref:PRK06851 family protein n=1 Tax=Desulfolucanica intricata TaxID=1285191 RepID=UPI000833AA94|nr:PRK06851 family protein [Desulfolucanica intricata]
MSNIKGRLKKVFPGGNTYKGFYSFYDYIIEPDANRIFVIKGGPGVGKSTFMRKIGETMLEKGYDVEFHCCSSDNGSLDGVVIPALKIAMLDGTAPHVVDPKNPGAVDEILHLGDHWDQAGLLAHKAEILACNKETGRLFTRAYSYLAGAKIFLDEVKFYYRGTGAFDVGTFDKKVLELTHEIFEGKPRQTDRPKDRHLFATAITPEGPESHLESIVGHLDKRYIIMGDDGTGKSTLVRRLMEAALMRGFDVEAYHCTLDPDLIDHLVIPGLSVAIINAVEPHEYKAKANDSVIDTMEFVSPLLNEKYLFEKNKAREMYRQCMEQAIWFLSQAKKEHDKMENYYVPYMNFKEINDRREQVMQRILDIAEKIK